MQSSATRTTPSLFERAGIKKDEHGERSVFRFKQTKYAGARVTKETRRGRVVSV